MVVVAANVGSIVVVSANVGSIAVVVANVAKHMACGNDRNKQSQAECCLEAATDLAMGIGHAYNQWRAVKAETMWCSKEASSNWQ